MPDKCFNNSLFIICFKNNIFGDSPLMITKVLYIFYVRNVFSVGEMHCLILISRAL